MILLYSVQNFKMIGQVKWKLWINEILQDLSLRCVLEGVISIIVTAPGPQGTHL